MRSRGSSLLLLLSLSLGPACGQTPSDGNSNVDAQIPTPSGLCGDGVVQKDEECDDGTANDDFVPGACRTDCRVAHCGDWTLDPGEICDDGPENGKPSSLCGLTCTNLTCGDGQVWEGYEECDDGNVTGGDGCGPSCTVEPGWVCTDGPPSLCVCADYWRGADCTECIVYVDGTAAAGSADGLTWATAFSRIQPALDAAEAAGPGCEVWVTRGVYSIYQGATSDTLILRSGVALYGGFAGTETLREDRSPWPPTTVLDGGDGVTHVVIGYDIADVVVDGFVVRGGSAMGEDIESKGGGLFVYVATRLTMNNTLFVGNHSTNHGGGAFISYGEKIHMWNVVFADNSADDCGGGLYIQGSEVLISESQFVANSAFMEGGGLTAYFETTVEITRSTFAGNTTQFDSGNDGDGGAISVQRNGLVWVHDSVIAGNRASFGGGVYVHEEAEFLCHGSTLVGNEAFSDGGLFNADTTSPLTIFNSILTDNVADHSPLIHKYSSIDQVDMEIHYTIHQGCYPAGRCSAGTYCPLTDAGFIAGPGNPMVTSTWSAITYDAFAHQTLLEVTSPIWTAGALTWLFVGLGGTGVTARWVPIHSNGEGWIRVWGDLNHAITGLAAGDAFTIHDLSLTADATAIDTANGFDASTLDRLAHPRYDDPGVDNGLNCDGEPTCIPGVDIGAYERQP